MLARLFDLPDADAVRHVELLFRSGGVWLWVPLGLMVVGVVYALALYRWERGLGKGWRIGLGALRAGVFVLILLMLLEPVLAVEMTLSVPRRVLVLLDRSESMSLRDGHAEGAEGAEDAEESRSEAARSLLTEGAKPGGSLRELAATHRLHLYGFGQSVEPLATLDPPNPGESEDAPLDVESLTSLPPDAPATRLGSAVLDAATSQSEVDALVLLTDGASTGGPELGTAAEVLRQRGVPVFIVGFGQPDPPDVRVASMVVQDTLFSEDTAPVRVALDSAGYDGQEVDVVLSLDGEETGRRTVTLTGGPQFAQFEIEPPRPQRKPADRCPDRALRRRDRHRQQRRRPHRPRAQREDPRALCRGQTAVGISLPSRGA